MSQGALADQMSDARPKLTRRRGACEECRQKKVRCDGASPCNHCQRSESLCEYNTRRSRRHLREKSVQSLDKHVSTTTQPYAINDSAIPNSSSPDHFSEVVACQDTEGLENPSNTPFSEVFLSQLGSDNAHSILNFDFLGETIPSIRKAGNTEKVKVLLSSEHQTCLSDLLRRTNSGGEHQSLDLNDLSMRKLVQRAFKEPGGLNLLIKEEDIMHIQEQFFDPGNLHIDVSDASLLIVSLAWGALLDPEVSSVSRAALLDAVLETSTLLLRENGSVRQFLALVAVLGLAEKTGSNKLPTLILGSISTVASLNIHLEPVLRKFCTSDEQVIQAKRAMWLLYCIDKSHTLRWQTFSLVTEGSLPIMNRSDSILRSDVATTRSFEWLWIRAQYSRICSNILQLRVDAEEEPSKDHSNRAVALSTALEEWYQSTRVNQTILSLDHNDAMRIKLQTSYYYYEALFQLLSISLPDLRSCSPIESQKYRELLKQPTRETVTLSSTIPSEYLLQDWYVSHKVVSLTTRLY
ncbi:Fungal Zn binuclear cluster domain containing protein [Pyrenophora tritici-repentis]|nr:Fungal Zn binuclear cluster domain containing protein [Pyrenophora tritici-repentis]